MSRTLRIAVTLALLAWLLDGIEWQRLLRLLGGLQFWEWFALLLFQLAGMWLAAWKWRLLLPDRSTWLLFRLNLVAAFYSLIAPGQLAVEAAKAYVLGRGRHDAEAVAASVILDKLTGMTALFLVGLAGLCLTTVKDFTAVVQLFALLLAASLAAMLSLRLPQAVRIAYAAVDGLAVRLPAVAGWMNRVKLLIDSWCELLQRPKVLFMSVMAGVAVQGVHVITVAAIAQQCGVNLPIAEWAWILGAISVATLLPISIGGAGVREGSFVGILAIFSVGKEDALAISFAVFGLQMALGMMGSVLHFFGKRGLASTDN